MATLFSREQGMKWTRPITCCLLLAIASLVAAWSALGAQNDELVEGILGMGGPIYSVEDQPGGAGRSDGSPYESSTIALRDGRLLMVFGVKQSPEGRRPLGMQQGMTSEDGGRTWSNPFPLKLSNGGPVNGGQAVSLMRLKSGALGAICGYIFFRSEDEGKTWSDGVAIGPHKWNMHVRNDSAVVLRSGRIVAPAYVFGFEPKAPDDDSQLVEEFSYGLAYYSDDEGRTWHESKNILCVSLDGGRRGMYQWDEWSLVELKDGRLLAMGRTTLGQLFQSISQDQGETWQLPTPSGLAADAAPCLLRRIPGTGHLLVMWTQASVEERERGLKRHRLFCAISRDEGETWENFKNFESGLINVS